MTLPSFDEVEELLSEGGHGYCRACKEESESYCDPDQRATKCSFCGENEVYGLEELIMMGEIE